MVSHETIGCLQEKAAFRDYMIGITRIVEFAQKRLKELPTDT